MRELSFNWLLVLKEYQRAFAVMFEAAQKTLRNVFGMEMVQLPKTKKSMQEDAGPSNSWIVVSTLSASHKEILALRQTPNVVLLTIILALILANGRSISEQLLDAFLSRMRVSSDPNVTADVQSYVKAGYLQRSKVRSAEGDTHIYLWGSRAKAEYSDDTIIEFMVGMYEANNRDRLRLDISRCSGIAMH